jgi:streptomycin 6-kinase
MFLHFSALISCFLVLSYLYRNALVSLITESVMKIFSPEQIAKLFTKQPLESIFASLYSMYNKDGATQVQNP